MKNLFSLKQFLRMSVAVGGLIAAPAFADPAANWNGPYVGGFVGGNWADFGDHGNSAEPAGNNPGFTGGGDVGTNWQYNQLVLGAEGDFSKLDNNSGSNGIKFDEDWQTTFRGRAGFAIDRFLPYVTGGLALTDTTAKVAGLGSDENLRPGLAAGGGVDAMLMGNWFGRVEYLHTDVPQYNSTFGGTTVRGGSGDDAVRVGLNYKF